MLHTYPSNVSRALFEKIQPLLEKARKKTTPRTVDLYEVFCGVLDVLKSGCQWRMLPREFPPGRTCYDYFQKWSERAGNAPSHLEEALKQGGWRGPENPWAGRENHLPYR